MLMIYVIFLQVPTCLLALLDYIRVSHGRIYHSLLNELALCTFDNNAAFYMQIPLSLLIQITLILDVLYYLDTIHIKCMRGIEQFCLSKCRIVQYGILGACHGAWAVYVM